MLGFRVLKWGFELSGSGFGDQSFRVPPYLRPAIRIGLKTTKACWAALRAFGSKGIGFCACILLVII